MTERIHLDFIVLGTQKAGTTSLHQWLVQHADISLPQLKETHFFSHEYRFRNGVDWYLKQFNPKISQALKGEIDPEYLYIEGAAERIKAESDVERFIIILRQPMQRAYSHYLMSVRRGLEDLPFDEAIRMENKRLAQDPDRVARDHLSYISRGLYGSQIKKYQTLFPKGKFLFIKFEELIGKDVGNETYKRISQFIGSTHNTDSVDRSMSSNEAATSRFHWLRDYIYKRSGKSILRKMISALMPADFKLKLAIMIDELNKKKLDKSKIKRIEEFAFDKSQLDELMADIEDVERLTGLDLANWKKDISQYRISNQL